MAEACPNGDTRALSFVCAVFRQLPTDRLGLPHRRAVSPGRSGCDLLPFGPSTSTADRFRSGTKLGLQSLPLAGPRWL